MGGDRMPFCTLRAWVLYGSAWTPYAASYYLIFRLQNPSNPNALTDALINVLPAAILGILVLSITQRWKWPPTGRTLFFVSHGTAAVCYAALWWIAVELLGAAFSLIVDHRWQFIPWGMYAAQWQAFSGLMIYGNLVGFAYVMQAQQRAAEEEQRRIQAETLRVQSDLNALRSQLNPHFLFNTLNSVIALVQNEPAKAERALVDLSEMLRYALSSHADVYKDEVSFKEELHFTEGYLALESLRLGKRLHIERSIAPETLPLEIPALSLQPLVENAVKHGIAPCAAGGTISISAHAKNGTLWVKIADNGVGAIQSDLEQSTGLGLRTVRRRLELYYKQLATMDITTEPGRGFTVQLALPQDEVR